MKNIILINNPPFRWQTRIYRKYANRFKEDIWILHKANSLKSGLYANQLYDFRFTDTENNTQIAHNFGSGNSLKFNELDSDYMEVLDFVEKNKRPLDIDKDNLKYLLFISIMFSKCKIIKVERLPDNKTELKERIEEVQRMITIGDKIFKCLIFDNIDDLNYWKTKAENYMKNNPYEHKPFTYTDSHNGSKINGQFFTPDSKADLLFSYLKTVDKDDLIVDICCGNGALLKAAERAGHPKENLLGYDIDNECIEQLKRDGYRAECKDVLLTDVFAS